MTILIAALIVCLFLAVRCWALDSLFATFRLQFGWTASDTLTGSDYGTNTNATTIQKLLTMGTSVANAAAGGADELYSTVTSLSASASASIDLTAFTNIIGTAAAAMARVKAIAIRPLSATDDTTIGTAATPLMVDASVANGFVSQSGTGWFKATTSTFDIPSGGILAFATPTAGGVLVDGTHKVIKLTNSDGAVAMKVQLTVCGGST